MMVNDNPQFRLRGSRQTPYWTLTDGMLRLQIYGNACCIAMYVSYCIGKSMEVLSFNEICMRPYSIAIDDHAIISS